MIKPQQKEQLQDLGQQFFGSLEELRSGLEKFSDEVADRISQKVKEGEYERVDELNKLAQLVGEFEDRLETLDDDFSTAIENPDEYVQQKRKRGSSGGSRFSGGISPKQMHEPVIEALQELGGEAAPRQIADRILPKIENKLAEGDKQGPPSSPTQPRWKTKLYQAGRELKEQGRIDPDSPDGEWHLNE